MTQITFCFAFSNNPPALCTTPFYKGVKKLAARGFAPLVKGGLGGLLKIWVTSIEKLYYRLINVNLIIRINI
jgi:hypothetical protein